MVVEEQQEQEQQQQQQQQKQKKQHSHVVVEELLQLLVAEVDAELLEPFVLLGLALLLISAFHGPLAE